jgi:type IV pilus assembly protein PilQ
MWRSKTIYLFLLLALVSCATDKSKKSDDESAPANSESAQSPASPEDSTADAGQTPDQTPDQAPPPPAVAEAVPAPVEPVTAPAQAQEPSTVPSGKPAVVTALDFDANVNGGTVILKTSEPVAYTTRKNETNNQFVIELQNTIVPKRFRRPYNTKEFPGAIASINAYQSKGSEKTARVVLQLRQQIDPGIEQSGLVIKIASTGVAAAPQVAVQSQTPASNTEAPVEANEGDGNQSDIDAVQSNDKLATNYLSGNSKFYGRPISLEVKDADIRDVLRLISEESGVNLLIQDDVQGKVSIKLKHVPWDQALLVVLKSKQLGYIKEGNILRITQQKTIEAESATEKRVLDAKRDLLPLHVKIFPISYSAASDIESQIRDFTTSRGKVHADKRTNSLVVTDIDDVLEKVKQLVARLDTQTPQVLIEAKVIEARERYTRLIGVNWSFGGASANLAPNSNGATSSYTPRMTSQPVTASQGAIGDIGIGFANLDFFGNLDASLKLLESENLVKIISAPRIVTLDRQKAQIDQTTQFPIFGSTVSPSGTAQPSITFQDVRLQLDVTPQISNDGGVTLDINVLREFVEAPEFSGSSSARPKNSRHAQTRVLIPNGETIVIGGIYQSDVTDGESGIPWLRKIPILGALFRQRNTDRQKNELVIFLTPRILNREKTAGGDFGG